MSMYLTKDHVIEGLRAENERLRAALSHIDRVLRFGGEFGEIPKIIEAALGNTEWTRMSFCCKALEKEVGEHKAFAGGGLMYPPGTQPSGQIEQASDGSWCVNGCCGGSCYVLTDLKFCPFCGTKLPE